jgi:outer membrane receptor protein involved in Fe transport
MTVGTETSFTKWGQSILVGFEYQGLKDNGGKIYQVVREDSEYSDAGDELLYRSASMMRLSNYGFFGQLMLAPIDDLKLTGGIRHDWSDTWGNHFSYRAATVYGFPFGLSLKAVYGTSFVPPAPAQLETSPLRFEGGIVGNPDLKSQKASTAEFAVEYRHKEWFNVSLNGFYTEIKDRVEFVFTGNTLSAQNVAASRTLGTEFSARGFYSPIFSEINVSYQYTVPIDSPDLTPSWWRVLYSGDGPGGKRLLYCPAWLINGHLGAAFPQFFFQASMAVNYVGKRKSSAANLRYNGEAYLLSQYATVDMTLRTLGFKPFKDRTTTISIHINNVFNQRFSEAGYLGVDFPSIGRTMYLKLNQEF